MNATITGDAEVLDGSDEMILVERTELDGVTIEFEQGFEKGPVDFVLLLK